jgi:hypothetical protein
VLCVAFLSLKNILQLPKDRLKKLTGNINTLLDACVCVCVCVCVRARATNHSFFKFRYSVHTVRMNANVPNDAGVLMMLTQDGPTNCSNFTFCVNAHKLQLNLSWLLNQPIMR